MEIPIFDLTSQYKSIEKEIDTAVKRVLKSGWFVLGKEGEAFEQEFAEYNGSKYAIGVNSGTDALHLALRALDITTGDEVITVPNTAIPTINAISLANATPVFVDIDPLSYNLNPKKLKNSITKNTKAIMPVHLYGQPANLDEIIEIAEEHGIPVIEDCAQAHGATYKGKKVGTFGTMGCFSFYPSKNLGAYGDAGIITTNNETLRDKLLSLRNYGQTSRYIHEETGTNSRLDEMQAAILRVKLKHLDKWTKKRRELAEVYTSNLNKVTIPQELKDRNHVYHLYVIRSDNRDMLREHLARNGVGTQIHYPMPAHLQGAYKNLGMKEGSFPITEKSAKQILSLPLYPELEKNKIRKVIELINKF
ncbi:DegT/DnrJ/EryC1/StrS family aminotransferase [Candidatus Woesearchaeota archaeon]|jgi:dTDP-4-amino-4,6-dideoxygalactose transaminase|nr:DegT/DnrJ/EryC1/StrS family aminotransferase [Candidatus Woesearchaeota archaeon]